MQPGEAENNGKGTEDEEAKSQSEVTKVQDSPPEVLDKKGEGDKVSGGIDSTT